MTRPSWTDLPDEKRRSFGNGIGPWWFPAWFRKWLATDLSGFFEEASWRHHDFGYYIGRTERERREYDGKFFRAMCRDAFRLEHVFGTAFALIISVFFYVSVRLFGWTAFHYSGIYRRIR